MPEQFGKKKIVKGFLATFRKRFYGEIAGSTSGLIPRGFSGASVKGLSGRSFLDKSLGGILKKLLKRSQETLKENSRDNLEGFPGAFQ